jgi:CheY-like chemotaxis protein
MTTKHGTILVVDDEEIMRDILQTLLARKLRRAARFG